MDPGNARPENGKFRAIAYENIDWGKPLFGTQRAVSPRPPSEKGA
jgi:hypothetical protein